nr:MAG TPA: hypothetical protein [Caudoviricetes sp.]
MSHSTFKHLKYQKDVLPPGMARIPPNSTLNESSNFSRPHTTLPYPKP